VSQPITTPAAGDVTSSATGALDKRIAEFLLDFGVAVQKHAIYPAGHPQLGAAVERVMKRLDAAMAGHHAVSIGIARSQVVIDNVATDPNNPLMKELAQRFHRHRIGSITISPELLRDELADFLAASSIEENEGPQIALAAQTERWPHIQLVSLTYDKLELMGEESGLTDDEAKRAGAKLIWLALARATLLLKEGDDSGELLDPRVLASALNDRKADAGYDQSVIGALMAITEALKGGQGEEAAETASKMTDLLKSLQPDTLQRLMEMGGDVEKRKRFVLDASQSLAAEAVLILVEAASKASRQGISHTMLRLIGKLALQAEKGGSVMRAGASRALKEQVEQLADDWDPRRLNPESYQDALDRMAQRRVFTLMLQRQHPCEPKRLVMTSLETDTLGAPVWLAVNQLISHGGISMLLDLLDRAPANSKVAEELWPLVATPDNLRHLLREEQIDPQLLERITTRLGLDVIELLLEGLESSETRTMRRKLLDLLAKFGADAGPMVVKRLEQEDTPWYVQRNLLTLLQLLPKMPAGFQPKRYLTHNDERVRREALKLMLRLPELREQTIVAALGDRDDGIVKLAMQAALTDCPKGAIPLIRRHCERRSISSELRALGLRIVGSAKDPESQSWLLGYIVTKTRFLKREKLMSKSPEMLSALTGLAAGWADDPGVQRVLDMAQRSKDLEIRAAATPRRKPNDRTNSLP